MPRAAHRPKPYRPVGKGVARLGELRSGGHEVVQPQLDRCFPTPFPPPTIPSQANRPHHIHQHHPLTRHLTYNIGPKINPESGHTLVSAILIRSSWMRARS
jgi:hypothetical protein